MAIISLSATSGVSAVLLPSVRFVLPRRGPLKHCNHGVMGLGRVSFQLNCEQQLKRFGKLSSCSMHRQRLTTTTRGLSAFVVCAAALVLKMNM